MRWTLSERRCEKAVVEKTLGESRDDKGRCEKAMLKRRCEIVVVRKMLQERHFEKDVVRMTL